MRYDRELLESISHRVDLFAYASQTMDFQQQGTSHNWFARCPLHVDKTPSLSIDRDNNYFYCFSCHRGGSIINWLQRYEHMPFSDAVEKAAKLADVDLMLYQNNPSECMDLFSKMARQQRPAHKKEITRQMLDESEIDRFSDEVPQEWIDEGIDPDVMRLFNVRIDHTANRIVYPVYDNDLHLIGFKGRTRLKSYKALRIPKYLNYYKIGTTDFFQGMKENREAIIRENAVIIFEGLKSVMKVRPWGYDYALSAETSRLNDAQIDILISMHIRDITVGFDSDVNIPELIGSLDRLRRFSNVYLIRDRHQLLGGPEAKASPCDQGREVFEILLRERVRI